MKIAVTSQNFRTVTNHAGKARRFLVLEIDEQGKAVELERLDLPKHMAFHGLDHASPHPIDGVDVVLSASFGPGFARKMAARNIIASLTEESDPQAAIAQFLREGPVLPMQSCGGH